MTEETIEFELRKEPECRQLAGRVAKIFAALGEEKFLTLKREGLDKAFASISTGGIRGAGKKTWHVVRVAQAILMRQPAQSAPVPAPTVHPADVKFDMSVLDLAVGLARQACRKSITLEELEFLYEFVARGLAE